MKSKIEEKLIQILSKENVLTSFEEKFVYSQDATNIRDSKIIADYVVFVETVEQVQKVMKLAFENNIPVIARGAGTNLVGACSPECGGIVMNFSKMNKILKINPHNLTATVQSGVVIKTLRDEVEKVGLFYPPDPSNLAVSTVGGSIALSSAGPKTFKYGSTKDYVIDMKVVTSDGALLHTGSNTIKNATGYNLTQLFIGSEGTLGIVVEATLKLVVKPESSRVILGYFDSVEAAAKSVDEIISHNLMPATIDFMDKKAIQTVEAFYPAGLLCDKEAALIVEVDGYEQVVDAQRDKIAEILRNSGASDVVVAVTDEEAQRIWTARRSSFASTAKLAPDVLTEDIIVPRENLAKLVVKTQEIFEKHGFTITIVGHVGDGNLHPQTALDLRDASQKEEYKLAKKELYTLAVDLGGTLSGEHGIGSQKRDYMTLAVEDLALDYMKKIKNIFDEKNILNPCKIFKGEK